MTYEEFLEWDMKGSTRDDVSFFNVSDAFLKRETEIGSEGKQHIVFRVIFKIFKLFSKILNFLMIPKKS